MGPIWNKSMKNWSFRIFPPSSKTFLWKFSFSLLLIETEFQIQIHLKDGGVRGGRGRAVPWLVALDSKPVIGIVARLLQAIAKSHFPRSDCAMQKFVQVR